MKPPIETLASQVETTGQGPDGLNLFAGVFARLGDVVGPGALTSLIRYGAQGEGARLAEERHIKSLADIERQVGGLLGMRITLEENGEETVHATAESSSVIPLANPGGLGLVVGILEGCLSSLMRRRVAAKGELVPATAGRIEIELGGLQP